MNQIMRVGNGIVIALERRMSAESAFHFRKMWDERMGTEVPCFLVDEARIVMPDRDDQPILFEFTGNDITPTFIAEFQRWWEGVTSG